MLYSIFYSILLIAAAQAGPIRAADIWDRAFDIPQDLYYLALHPSGADFCNNELGRMQAARFDKRYGRRFNALIEVVRRKGQSTWPQGEVQLSSCLSIDAKSARKRLDDFDRELSMAEARYGLTTSVR